MPRAKEQPVSKPNRTTTESKAATPAPANGHGSAFSYNNSKGTTYYLHTKQVQLKNGSERPFYFFAKDVRPDAAVDKVPDGYEVSESTNSGLPVLKKKAS